jgi:hypothetical protein
MNTICVPICIQSAAPVDRITYSADGMTCTIKATTFDKINCRWNTTTNCNRTRIPPAAPPDTTIVSNGQTCLSKAQLLIIQLVD